MSKLMSAKVVRTMKSEDWYPLSLSEQAASTHLMYQAQAELSPPNPTLWWYSRYGNGVA